MNKKFKKRKIVKNRLGDKIVNKTYIIIIVCLRRKKKIILAFENVPNYDFCLSQHIINYNIYNGNIFHFCISDTIHNNMS